MADKYLTKKVIVPETLRKLPIGEHRYSCTEIGSLNTVRNAASRLNQTGDFCYSILSPDNGITIVINKTLRQDDRSNS